jgi:hypothetical protein
MDDYQCNEAVGLLCIITDVDPNVIEDYEDHALDAWLAELGYEWREDRGFLGAYVPIAAQPVFAPIAAHVECDDFGPLFAEVHP